MEIIIAMALAFVLGAYVRAPFKLFRKREPLREHPEAVGEKDGEQERIERQLNNLLNYGRERN